MVVGVYEMLTIADRYRGAGGGGPVRQGLWETFNNKPYGNVISTRLVGRLSVRALECSHKVCGTLFTKKDKVQTIFVETLAAYFFMYIDINKISHFVYICSCQRLMMMNGIYYIPAL